MYFLCFFSILQKPEIEFWLDFELDAALRNRNKRGAIICHLMQTQSWRMSANNPLDRVSSRLGKKRSFDFEMSERKGKKREGNICKLRPMFVATLHVCSLVPIAPWLRTRTWTALFSEGKNEKRLLLFNGKKADAWEICESEQISVEGFLPTYDFSHTLASFIFNHFRSIKRENKTVAIFAYTTQTIITVNVQSNTGKVIFWKFFLAIPFGTLVHR